MLDRQKHAITEHRYHRIGVYTAECGHLLMQATELFERPYGRTCETCAGITLHAGERLR